MLRTVYAGAELEEQDSTPQIRLEDAWDRIRSKTGVERKVPDVTWVDETGIRYRLKGEEQSVPADSECAYEPEVNRVYLTPEFTADWEALADVLVSELGGQKHRIINLLESGAPTLEDRAVDAVRHHENSQFDTVADVRDDDYYEEYDVQGCDVFARLNDEKRYIEIKARRNEDSPVRLIGREPEKALEEERDYYLYVVVCSQSGRPMYFRRLRDPANHEYTKEKTWRFIVIKTNLYQSSMSRCPVR